MDITLHKSHINSRQSHITITGSKSESNRLLLLQALYPQIELRNVSNSDDSDLMAEALKSSSHRIDIHHAGTAMRFLTAYFAIQEGREVTLTGSKRMKERPIKILVEALKDLGADITYLENEGFPPLKIKGKHLTKHKIALQANVSSQYISALLLIASRLENGIELHLEGDITSVPYIKMTLSLLEDIGIKTAFSGNTIKVDPKVDDPTPKTLTVESDWSSASYFFSIVALCDVGTEITLASYKENSLQGDSSLVEFYKQFGVETTFAKHSITLLKSEHVSRESLIEFDLTNAPDIAQTIAVSCFALGLACHLTGLHTLKIKETDRLVALKNEIEKLGGKVEITENALHLSASDHMNEGVSIATYNDHRMAMAFAPLALKIPIIIKDAMVVTKSYPTFWMDLESIGFRIAK
ncbi:3-phosphoshikimate 1-carboxyvinyltransferase [Aestuariivivens sediminicola]|uniref:3-phosphoshikimate 1-carboxyvinyltransferase n=1 Tax=Aestuariivivens sediminicola TaxID=2913560 RepID=UPI001F583F8F|nr:3-phosphoshikimate 1-carboxyvinyltransferase [Aestuariivivens sediminicola]